ncbi:helix-turn-helix domain-containing protein [Streptomyces sp. NPDC017993]|uniref:helix-turn-helix domain-containing protein n=1 Tax=Streptomyces sp. NPDC017993 TaxID=3365027 RepID=UPI0037A0E018
MCGPCEATTGRARGGNEVRADRRKAILKAEARGVIERHGVRGPRMPEIAAEAGTSTAHVSHHFDSPPHW